MQAKHVLDRFNLWLEQSDKVLEYLAIDDAINLMLGFYREIRIDDCDLANDGDMLLFQWGLEPNSLNPSFRYNLTRHLVVEKTYVDDDGEWIDDSVKQLSLTFCYISNLKLNSLNHGNQWCLHPEDLEQFEAFLRAHPATLAVKHLHAQSIDLSFKHIE